MALRVIEVVRQLYNQLAATMITITCLIDNNAINREYNPVADKRVYRDSRPIKSSAVGFGTKH